MRLPTSLRSHLTFVLATGSIILVAALIGAFNVVLRGQIDSDLNARLTDRASVARASVVVRNNKAVVREAPGDTAIDQQVWVIVNGRVVEAPPATARATGAARIAAAHPRTFIDVGSLDLRLYSQPLRDRGRTIGAVVAGASLGPAETTARRALVASIVLGLLVVAGVLSAIRLAINAALRPVDRMTAEAAAWSVEDLDQRFADRGTHDELARLASTFNGLLGRLAASFRHEQRFSAEVSHELRTPLAKLIMESELALRRERTPPEYRAALASVASDARDMQRVVETLLAVARSEIDLRAGTSDSGEVAASVVRAFERSRDGVEVRFTPPRSPPRLGVDSDLAERVLAPIVANAVQFANSQALLSIRQTPAAVEFVVRDDGPGVASNQREAIFTPGYRGSARALAGDSQGTGLGLALSRRLARAADGDVTCGDGNGKGGGEFVISLPAA